jgi:yecA family protein
MNKAGTQLLTEFLNNPARPDGTLRFHELQGFLFAIACSPETIAPSEWLPLIGNDESLNFADESEAQEILGLVMDLYNEVNTAVLERSNSLPAGCAFDKNISKNFEDDSSISQWSRGFAAGHDWLDEECGATLMVLSFFGSNQLANAYYNDMRPGKRKRGDESFENFAVTMRRMFPDALASYAHIGRSIFEAVLEHGKGGGEPASGVTNPAPAAAVRSTRSAAAANSTDTHVQKGHESNWRQEHPTSRLKQPDVSFEAAAGSCERAKHSITVFTLALYTPCGTAACWNGLTGVSTASPICRRFQTPTW